MTDCLHGALFRIEQTRFCVFMTFKTEEYKRPGEMDDRSQQSD